MPQPNRPYDAWMSIALATCAHTLVIEPIIEDPRRLWMYYLCGLGLMVPSVLHRFKVWRAESRDFLIFDVVAAGYAIAY